MCCCRIMFRINNSKTKLQKNMYRIIKFLMKKAMCARMCIYVYVSCFVYRKNSPNSGGKIEKQNN